MSFIPTPGKNFFQYEIDGHMREAQRGHMRGAQARCAQVTQHPITKPISSDNTNATTED